MAEFNFFCSRCGHQIECDAGYCGSQINCPACQQPITVPQALNPPITPPMQTANASTGKAPNRTKRNTLLVATVAAVLLFLVVCAGLLWVWASSSQPVAWWHADGNVRDSAGRDDGILVGNPLYSRGIVGEAFEFDGAGSYVKILKFRMPDVRKGITITFWMKASANNEMHNYQGLVASDYYGVEISNGFQSNMGVNFYVSSDRGNSWGAISEANGGGATITAGEWHHIAGTYDGADVALYIDGQAWGNSASYSGNVSPISRSGFLAIGSEDGRTAFPNCLGTRYFNGLIDEVRIYNRAMSASEIRSIYNRR